VSRPVLRAGALTGRRWFGRYASSGADRPLASALVAVNRRSGGPAGVL